MQKLNWQLISQLVSYAVAIISALVSFFNNRKNNKTIKEIELTKEKFAQENERLKRQQAKEDYKNQLITNFLGSINAYQATHKFDKQEGALRACGEVMPVCNKEQRVLVNNVMKALNAMSAYQPSQEVWDNCTKAISEATNKFSLLATKKEDK